MMICFSKSALALLLIFSTDYAKAESKSAAVEELIKERQKLIHNLQNLPFDEKEKQQVSIFRQVNILFFKAQKARLSNEIASLREIEDSWLGYRGWEKDAAKITRIEKEKTIDVMEELIANPPQKPVRCMSEINVDKKISNASQSILSTANRTYSKSNSSALNSMDCHDNTGRKRPGCIENRILLALNEPLALSNNQILDLIIENGGASSNSLRQREKPVGLELVQQQIRKPYEQLLSESERGHLLKFGITNWRPAPQCRDLSGRYSTPKLQPPKTAKCAGYAIASDMEEVMNRNRIFSKDTEVSSEYAYVALVAAEEGYKSTDGLCNLLGTYVDPLKGVATIAGALNSKVPICSTNQSDPNLQKSLRQYSVSKSESINFTAKPSPNLFKALIDNGITPMITVNSEARSERENWLFPKSGGGYRHVINITGYCTARDPDCLEEQDYFIVRDSLGTKPIHYRVPAESLATAALTLDKIMSVEEVSAR